MRCKAHKRYKAKLRPRCDCVECWQMFLENTADYNDVCLSLDIRDPQEGTYARAFDGGTNEEILIRHMLFDKKRELEKKADCNICKNKGHDCLMNLDGTCDNFKKEKVRELGDKNE